MEKIIFFVSHSFFSLDQIPKIQICHMVVNEHPEVIEWRRRLISVDVCESEDVLSMLPSILMVLLIMNRMGVVW